MSVLLDNIELTGAVNGHEKSSSEKSRSELYFTFQPTKRIDYVLVFKEGKYTGDEKVKKEAERDDYLAYLTENGIDVEEDQFIRSGELVRIWKLHGQFDALCDAAEDLQMKKETKESDILIQGVMERNLPSIVTWFKKHDPFMIKDATLKEEKCYFVEPFDKERLSDFRNWYTEDKFFTFSERNRLLHHICTMAEDGIEELLHSGAFSDAYPLHLGPLQGSDHDLSHNMRRKLSKDWATWRRIFKYQPIEAIKNYFGEKIGLYFCWLGFYTTFLIPAALVGVICFAYGVVSAFTSIPGKEICDKSKNNSFYHCPLCDKYCSYFLLSENSCTYTIVSYFFDNEATLFFATFMSFWATLFLEFWKRKQASIAYEWHTRGYEEEEEKPRPEYIRTATRFRLNPVNQKMEPFMPKRQKLVRYGGAMGVVIFFVALVIASLFGVIVYRAVVYTILLARKESLVQTNAKIIVSGSAATINLLVIFALRIVYSKLAKILTDWETPRTLTDYEDSFTIKMFWFQFVNTYSSVFYVAFFKGPLFVGKPGQYTRFTKASYRLEGCADGGCFLELSVQLIIIMVGQQFVTTMAQIVLPRLQKWYNRRSVLKSSIEMPAWERDYDLEPREELSLFWEYLEIALQYGFVTMFVAAFPLAPFFALVNNVVEIRVDAINFVENFRRPVPYRGEDIGAWYTILTTLTQLSVLVNALVLAFTSDLIPRIVYTYIYSEDGTLRGYVNFSLSYFNVSDFSEASKPKNPTSNVPYTLPFCRYPGFYEPRAPYRANRTHFLILSVRLGFIFLFQWLVSGFTRIIAWYIPDVPKMLKFKIKRENYLAKEALKNFKERRGKRKPRFRGQRSNTVMTERTPLKAFSTDML